MRSRLYLTVIPGAAVALLAMAAPLGDSLTLQAGSRAWVEGTSTVRSYRCETGRVEGSAAMENATTTLAQLAAAPRRGEISIQVASLDCRNGTMNGHMRRALKAEENPTIRFRATSITVTPGGESQGSVRMSGPLTIAGGTQAVSIDATATREANGNLRVRGSKQLDMTQFGVQPPRLMMGTMRVRPAVTVGFDVVLRP
jgi:polyisoprenoid-binding protein YceI